MFLKGPKLENTHFSEEKSMLRVLSGQQFNGGRTEHTWANVSTRNITNAWKGKQNAKKMKLDMKK